MTFKRGVSIKGIQPETVIGMLLADQALRGDLVVTSVIDGTHMEGSLHYKGLAFDVRLLPGWIDGGSVALRAVLGPLGFDVVLEKDHCHVEYDPK
jgi:hypothetical protein